MSVAFLDLDRTLLTRASGRVLSRALVEEGVLPKGHSMPAQGLLFGLYDRLGENLVSMGLTRAGAGASKGWEVAGVKAAAERAVPELLELVAPYAHERLAALRASGHRLVLATTTPIDYIEPFARSLGLDDVIATRYEVSAGHYTGGIAGGFVWGPGKLKAVRRWCEIEGVDLGSCAAFSDSVFDVPLLSAVGAPHSVNADLRLLVVAKLKGWPCEQWDRPDGVPGLFGLEPYDLLRHLVRPQTLPYARFSIEGIDEIPQSGPAILAANHRSYFDVAALALVAARLGRPVRAMAKAELFEAPVISQMARSLGAIRVDRGEGVGEAYAHAKGALLAGEVLIILPQGTIPRGEAFFDPVLRGHAGVARLALETGAPVVPIGLWGTEEVWPRSARLPRLGSIIDRPRVSVRIGAPVVIQGDDPGAVTGSIMAAISALLPDGGRIERIVSEAALTRTEPPGASEATE
jgi:putative phosphoserine phosphatase/1-acylglycerol-3-phosphate O-acyltransferase